MSIKSSFTVMDPPSGEKLHGEFRARFDGSFPSDETSVLKKEVHFSLCEVLNFSGRPVREMIADLPELSKAVTKEARPGLAKVGALGNIVIENIRWYAEGEDPIDAWSDGLPRFSVPFSARDRQTGLELAGQVSGRFVGITPTSTSELNEAIGKSLHRALERAEDGIVPFFMDIQRANDQVSEELATIIGPLGGRGQVVIEQGKYDEATNAALVAFKSQPQKPQALGPGARVRVTAWNGKSRPGRIEREGGGQFLVVFDDGGQAWISPQHLLELKEPT